MTWRKPKPPLTPKQLEIEKLLTCLAELPVGASVTLPDRAGDGFGDLIAKRHSQHTFVFQRAGYQGRSRWADNSDQMRQEIATYLDTGKLHEPENIKGW